MVHRKQQKGSIAGNSKGGNFVAFGDFGMQALERGRITARQIESARVAAEELARENGGQFRKLALASYVDSQIRTFLISSISSNVLGQSSLSNRDKLRSANSFPPV